MAYEPKDGSGSLFKNDKGDNPNRPDYRGDIMIEGVVYSLSAWIKEGQKGKFMSLSAQPKEAPAPQRQQAPQARPQQRPARQDDFQDSDVPF